jgi:drug/metabolite transporter (DMT)-like permease
MAGILYSIGAAFFWSIAIILFRKSGDGMSPIALNFFKCLVATLLLVPTLLVTGTPFFPVRPASDWWILALSGVVGITLADTLFFASLVRLGAGLTAIVSCLYLPAIIVLSYLFLGERLEMNGLVGGAFVLSALFISSFWGNKIVVERKSFIVGMILGILGLFALVVGVVIIKEVLNRSDVVWATTVRIFFGLSGTLVLVLVHPERRRFFKELRPSVTWKWAIPASIMGNYFALLCWLAGMKYTMVSLAAILNQLSAIMVMILAAVFLQEKITWNRTVSISLAVIGAIIAVYN